MNEAISDYLKTGATGSLPARALADKPPVAPETVFRNGLSAPATSRAQAGSRLARIWQAKAVINRLHKADSTVGQLWALVGFHGKLLMAPKVGEEQLTMY